MMKKPQELSRHPVAVNQYLKCRSRSASAYNFGDFLCYSQSMLMLIALT